MTSLALAHHNNHTNSRWIHPSEALIHRKVTYTVKFIGYSEVPGSKGMELVKLALQRLKFSRHIKRSEGTKAPKVDLSINISSVIVQDAKNKLTLHRIKLHRISFCADDKKDRRLFAFITKHDDGKHYCYGFDSPRLANEITLTIGQAFELAYEKYLKTSPLSPQVTRKQVTQKSSVDEMNARIKELEEENKNLRERIRKLELEKSTADTSTQQVAAEQQFPVQPQADPFNMQPFAPPIPPRAGPMPSNQPPPGSPKMAPNMRKTKDLFDVTASPATTRKNYVDARTTSSSFPLPSSSHFSPPATSKPSVRFTNKNPKGNYHVLSHPLVRKKISRPRNKRTHRTRKHNSSLPDNDGWV